MPFMKIPMWGILWMLCSQISLASQQAQPSCVPTSYSEVITCAIKQSKDLQLNALQIQSANKLEEKAKQWVNPDLEAENLWKGSEQAETSAKLLFALPLGGKRSALLNEATSEKAKILNQSQLFHQEKRLEIMLSLYRLTHLKIEISLEEESVETFKKVVSQFEKKALRTPEQDVSLSIFKMAIADHQLRLSRLKSLSDQLFKEIETITGIDKALITKNLPAKKDKWPEVFDKAPTEASPQIKVASADVNLARSLKEKADAEAYPDIKLGPSLKSSKEGNDTNNYVGIALSFPLPVLSQNSAARSYQEQKAIESEQNLKLTIEKENSRRSSLVSFYRQTVQSLKDSLNTKILMEKHEQIEKQFFKGLVSSSLVIEAHRQLFDLQERQNSSELEALQAYGKILIIDNEFQEVLL